MTLPKLKARERAMISGKVSKTPTVSSQERYSMIAEAAYFRAAERNFQGGDPVEDWLAAEKEIDEKIAKEG
jgi:hypothetical protein